ncbi:hypothetical protein ZIOFF_040952 [Zingiber officinale]|uniref:Uncharacterized protein n=1 Tax=Zingiber officinale TaxID=94328 RepID=A0A8J5KYD7_ZINOF|nr:hypothetical protein ZIOFF_040952 [Zingiber officinale]
MSYRAHEKVDGPVVILDCEWMANLKEKVEKTPRKDVRAERATIFQVPNNIRAGDTNHEACSLGEAYNPKIVSLGPYHRLDEQLQVWNTRLKWPCLKRLLERSPDNDQAIEKCIDRIKEREREVRSAYAEEFTRSKVQKQQEQPKPSAALMGSSSARDAAPMKQPSTEEKQPEEEGTLIQQWQWAEPLIYHDLLMLENQIPLSLLRELHGIILSHDKSPSMDELILSFFKEFSLTKHITKIPEGSCHHLLHLFHSSLIPKKQPTTRGIRAQLVAEVTSAIPCARDLIESRVKVKKKQGVACSSFLDLSFDSGRLEIPEIHVDDGTNTLLRNLIAFEQCLPRIGDYLTTYAWFMDSVIDNSADVALLRRKHVLVSGLGSDEEVAKLFNSLCKEVMVDPNQCYLEETIKEVNKYYRSKRNRCYATLNHNYFSNPWASISVVAAIILFVLTFIQTLYSMCDSCYKA